MRRLYKFALREGTFYICSRQEDDRFVAMFDEEQLGNYASSRYAAEAIANGTCQRLLNGIDPSTFNVPEELDEWVRLR